MFTKLEVKELKKQMIDKRIKQKELVTNIEGLSKSMCSQIFACKTTSAKFETAIKNYIGNKQQDN